MIVLSHMSLWICQCLQRNWHQKVSEQKSPNARSLAILAPDFPWGCWAWCLWKNRWVVNTLGLPCRHQMKQGVGVAAVAIAVRQGQTSSSDRRTSWSLEWSSLQLLTAGAGGCAVVPSRGWWQLSSPSDDAWVVVDVIGAKGCPGFVSGGVSIVVVCTYLMASMMSACHGVSLLVLSNAKCWSCISMQCIRLEGWSLRLTGCFKFLEMEYEEHEMWKGLERLQQEFGLISKGLIRD